MKKYRVWFEQINCTYIDVDANGQTSAISKAEKEWKKSVAEPRVTSVAELKEAQ